MERQAETLRLLGVAETLPRRRRHAAEQRGHGPVRRDGGRSKRRYTCYDDDHNDCDNTDHGQYDSDVHPNLTVILALYA